MVKYENYGDVNPVEHGGLYIKDDLDFENCFYIVEFNPIDDAENTWMFWESYLDLEDVSQAQLEDAVDGTVNSPEYNKHMLVSDIINYYGHTTFSDGKQKLIEGEEKLLDYLAKFDIYPKGMLTKKYIRDNWFVDGTNDKVYYIQEGQNYFEYNSETDEFAYNGAKVYKGEAENIWRMTFLKDTIETE
jgi:hypothetical protein